MLEALGLHCGYSLQKEKHELQKNLFNANFPKGDVLDSDVL